MLLYPMVAWCCTLAKNFFYHLKGLCFKKQKQGRLRLYVAHKAQNLSSLDLDRKLLTPGLEDRASW